jgi:hypothetical protein
LLVINTVFFGFAKRLRDPYRPGERTWIKTKDKSTPRFAEELAGATSGRRSGTARERSSVDVTNAVAIDG